MGGRGRRPRESDEQHPAGRRQGPRQRRARHRRQAPRGAAGPGRAPVSRSPPHRGRPGHGQDRAREGDRAQPRLHLPADPVHAGPAAVGRDRPLDLQPEDPGVRVPARADHEPGGPRGRDQPGHAQDAELPARVHGGASGDDRRRLPRDAGPVPRDRHPEPDRVRGHVRAARGAAGPVHAPHPPGLPGPPGRDRDPRRAEADPPARRPGRGVLGRRAARAAGVRSRHLRGPGRERLHRPSRGVHPDPSGRLPRRQPARLDRPVPGLAGARRAPGPGLRHPGRREGPRRSRRSPTA